MKEKRKVSLLAYIMTLLIMVILIVAIIMYFETKINETQTNEQNSELSNMNVSQQETVNAGQEDFSLNLEELYSYVLKYNNLSAAVINAGVQEDYSDASFYKDSKVTYSNLSNIEKEIVVFSNIDDEDIEYVNISEIANVDLEYIDTYYDNGQKDIKVISQDVLNNTAKKIFGEQATDIQWDEMINCNVAEYIEYADGNYYWYPIEGGGLGYTKEAESSITSIEKQGDYLYIYDKYLLADMTDYYLEETGASIKYYTTSDESQELSNISENDIAVIEIYEDNFKEVWNWLYKNYADQLNTYKHTFQIGEDGNYYWVSSEIVE